ncbi:MAG TPA: deoxyribonuclease IV [Desulfuromonadales bacterium]
MLLIGAHMSIAGGLHLAIARGVETGCAAIQVFTKNASQWRGKAISPAEAEAFRQAWQESSIGPVIAHDSYLINLAAPDEAMWRKSIAAFVDEMERCAVLGIPELVMHPGAHLGAGEEVGLQRLAAAFREIFAAAPAGVTVLLENTAGQGTCLGSRFEHLAAVIEQVPEGRFGVCLDTCHAYAAGYDLATAAGYAAVISEFDRVIGLERLRAFHVNDCKKGLGCRVDRHEHIGQGSIGEAGFAALMQDSRFAGIPKILETPKGDDGELDRMNLALLRRLAGEGKG